MVTSAAGKLAGDWAIDVPGKPGLRMFLRVQAEGNYSTHLEKLDSPPFETGNIQLRSNSYTLTALTGEQAGKTDKGSCQFTGANIVVLRGLYGKGTWVRVDEAGQALETPASDIKAHERSIVQHPVKKNPLANWEAQGTAVSAGRYSAESEVEGTAKPFGRNEFPGSHTSGFAVPFEQLSKIATTPAATTEPPKLQTPTPLVKETPTLVMRPDTATAGSAISSAAAKATNANRPIKDKWALVVGISEFQNRDLNLKCPAIDARDFGKFLVEQCHFAEDHVRVLTNENATRAHILNELGDKWLPRVVRPDDLVVVYLSTHGSPSDLDVGGVNYLLAWDSDPESLYSSGVPMQDLMRIIKGRLRSDRVMMVLDACYSGNVNPQAKGIHRGRNIEVEEIVQGTGQLVISSSQSNQVSWESKSGANSVFTKHLMSSLRHNGDKTKLGDAFKSLKDRVEEEVQRDRGHVQTPVMRSQWEGSDLMLSVPPTDPRPGL